MSLLINQPTVGETARPLYNPPAASLSERWLAYPLLAIIVALYAVFIWSYHADGNGGVDQNGYLVSARLLAEKGHLSFVPENPYQFAGRMMIVEPGGRIYAKYPFGYPLLAAIARFIGGSEAMYWVNPLCTISAVLLSYFLFRRVLGPTASLMGMIWLAANPVTLAYVNDAGSHASTLWCVVAGAWGLLSWWERGSAWRGLIGGFALGYACTIRYTEFLLVLPVLFVALARVRFRPWRLWRSWPVLVGWAIPIAALAGVLWYAYGAPWRTGYSFCREQTGFGWDYFLGDPNGSPPRQGNWVTYLYQMNHTGLFLMLPMAAAGMIGLFWRSWRIAGTVALWVVPPTTLYMFYYWAPVGEETVGYLRFFLTVFPGMLLAGLWLLEQGFGGKAAAHALGAGVLTLLAAAINMHNITPQMEGQLERNLALRNMKREINRRLPAGSAIFAEETYAHQLDCAGGYQLFDLGLFRPNAFQPYRAGVTSRNPDDPWPLQRERAISYMKLLGVELPDGSYRPKPQNQIDAAMLEIVQKCLARGQRVGIIFRGDIQWNMLRDHGNLRLVRRAYWEEPPAPPPLAAGLLTHWVRGVDVSLRPTPRPNLQQKRSRTWTLYEVLPPG